jgi:hypothetical protein
VSSIAKKLGLFIAIISMSFGVVSVMGDEPVVPITQISQDSSLYDFSTGSAARIEDERVIAPSEFLSLNSDDEIRLRNESFELFYNDQTTGIKVRNLETGYVWNSVIDDADAGTFNGLLSSSIGFEYINIAQNHSLRQNIGLNDTIHSVQAIVINDTFELRVSIEGFCTSRQCSNFIDEYLAGNPSYDIERMEALGFVNVDISFTVSMELTDQGLRVRVPYSSIAQGNSDKVVLGSLMIFPGLGATEGDELPGYMVVPDGMGALIRYKNNEGQFVASYEERYYGSNQGITSIRNSVTNQRLLMPLFGMVHGTNQHAVLGVIEQGDSSSRLIVIPAGANNVPYNLIYPKYDFNQTYLQSFTSDGLGGVQRIHQTSTSDISVHYYLLSNEEANYVGMANTYQEYLVREGVLTRKASQSEDIPLHTQVIMSDSRAQFVGTQAIVMTTLDQTRQIIESLESAGITNTHLSLLGWNNGGYSGHLPSPLRYDSAVGSRRDFERFFTDYAQMPIYLVNNYIYSAPENGRIRYRRDVAMGVNRFRLEYECYACVYDRTFTLYPATTQRLALDDLDDVVTAGVKVLFEDLGNTLFSYYQNDWYQRDDSLALYEDVMQAYESHAAYVQPSAYAWDYMDTYFDTPLYHSQLKIFDETIPLLSTVLAGHMDLFSLHLNFNSVGRSQLLRMIDFNVYPSYVVTNNRSSDLKGSDIERYFATEFASWEPTMIEEYTFVNEALQSVLGATLVSRDRLANDVVVNTYDNGTQIVINYGAASFDLDGVMIDAQSYVVQERGE